MKGVEKDETTDKQLTLSLPIRKENQTTYDVTVSKWQQQPLLFK